MQNWREKFWSTSNGNGSIRLKNSGFKNWHKNFRWKMVEKETVGETILGRKILRWKIGAKIQNR